MNTWGRRNEQARHRCVLAAGWAGSKNRSSWQDSFLSWSSNTCGGGGGGDSDSNLWTSDRNLFQRFHVSHFLSESVRFGNWREKMENLCFVCQIGLIVVLIFAPTVSVVTSEGVGTPLSTKTLMSKSHADSGWLCFSFFLSSFRTFYFSAGPTNRRSGPASPNW